MLSKTIVLELIQEQYPKLHRRLRLSRSLLQEIERYATDLRATHLTLIASGMEPVAARELALQELHERLAQEAARYGE
jgi:hypothetical protein